jgi:hypothetical protein
MEVANPKFVNVWGGVVFRLVLLLCCGPDGNDVVLQLDPIHRRAFLLVLRW